MKKVLAISLVVLMLCGCIAGCAKKVDDTYEIALVTDVGNIDDKSFNQGAWEGVKAYAEANKITYNYYRPSEDSTAARVETIGTAIEKGAKIVVCPGYLFEEAVFEVQDTYPEVAFLLLDGEPHDAGYVYAKTFTTHCILYQEEQAGYFAGYAAVKDGYTKLGFLGGMAVPAVIRFGYGYVQGAEAAAKELGLAAGTVSIKYWYSGGFAPTDDIKIKMDGWFSEGVEVVFACGGGIYLSAVSAADAVGGKIIGVDKDQAFEADCIITSAMKDLTNSVKLALTSFYDNDGAWDAEHAGVTATLGVKDDCVGLPTAEGSWRFTNYTVAEYEALYAAVKDGTVVVSNDTTVAPAVALVSVDYQN